MSKNNYITMNLWQVFDDYRSKNTSFNDQGRSISKAALDVKIAEFHADTLHQQIIAIREQRKAIETLNNNIKMASESSGKLGKRIFWLNWIIAIASTILALVSVIDIMLKMKA